MVEFTKEDKKVYGMYFLLRKYAPNANLVTLSQISLYIAKSTDDFDVNHDCSITLNGDNESYQISLNDGRKIFFSGDLDNFGFTISKEEKDISMSVKTYESKPGDLTTACVYGEVKTVNDGMFVVTFRPSNIIDDSLKYGVINYYSEEEINWVYEISGEDIIEGDFDIVAKSNLIYPFAEKSYFDVTFNRDVLEMDCFNGYLSNVLTRVDLLYDNVKKVKNNKLVKSK